MLSEMFLSGDITFLPSIVCRVRQVQGRTSALACYKASRGRIMLNNRWRSIDVQHSIEKTGVHEVEVLFMVESQS